MAGTITVDIAVQVENGGLNDTFLPGTQTITETNLGVTGGTNLIPTSDTVIPDLTGLTAEGWCVMQNLDATNYITWGPDNSGSMVVLGKLKPGESITFRVAPTVVLHAQANTASCLLFCRVYED
jgi:hypothetical protein